MKRVAYIKDILLSRESFNTVQFSIGLDSLSFRRIFAVVLLNGNVDCLYFLRKLAIRVPRYHHISLEVGKELFIIPKIKIISYLKKSGDDSFFPRALNIANNISPPH